MKYTTADAFKEGLLDGLQQPDEMTSGLTFGDDELSELYDVGVNMGQRLGRLWREPFRNLTDTQARGYR